MTTEPEAPTGFLGKILGRLEANRAWAAAFTCPRRRGEEPTCTADPETGIPYVQSPMGLIPCPAHTAENCAPHRAIEEIARTTRETRETAGWLAWATRAGIPAVNRAASWRSEPLPFLQAAQRYITQGSFREGRALVLASPATGVGKSWAAAAALRAVWPSAGAWLYVPALVTALLAPDTRTAALTMALQPPLVVLDDLGRDYLKAGGIASGHLDRIIYEREGNRLPTIITTNSTQAQLETYLSPASYDRLAGWATMVEGPADMSSLRGRPLRA